jgi:DNA-directed RNA polymerase specialized sigma24 family protein
MGRQELERVCLDLREGRASMGEFFEAIEKDLQRMAAALFTRWVLPPCVSSDDVRQQMALSILEERRDLDWVPNTRNKKGQLISILTHVLYHAHVAGKRWLHSQRGAKRRSGKAMSRFPIAFSALYDGDDDGGIEQFEQTINGTQDDDAGARAVLLKVYDTLPNEQAIAWAVYVQEGDEGRAMQRIDASLGLATTCRVSTPEETRGLVKAVVKKGREIARRLEA